MFSNLLLNATSPNGQKLEAPGKLGEKEGMRFFLFALFALFWMAVGLGVAVLPINGSTVWEKCSFASQTSGKAAAVTSAPSAAEKETHRPLGNYTAQERANIDTLIRGSAASR